MVVTRLANLIGQSAIRPLSLSTHPKYPNIHLHTVYIFSYYLHKPVHFYIYMTTDIFTIPKIQI